MKKEILVAIDGSVYSNQSLSYLSLLFADDDDIHFHLTTMVSSSVSVMPSATDPNNSLMPTSGDNEKKRLQQNGT